MKPESILKALGRADPALLELPPAKGGGKRLDKPLRRGLLAAAAAALLITTAYAGVAGARYLARRWSGDAPISERKLADNWYELYFADNPAAEDAPDTLEQFYLPTAPAGYVREHTTLSYGDAFETENSLSWIPEDALADYAREVSRWEAAHPAAMTQAELTAWEAEHPAPVGKIPSVHFSQKPLKALMDGNVFAIFGTLHSGEPKKSGEILGNTEYVTYTWAEGDEGEETCCFWLDEARHYIFCMSFSGEISRTDREAFLRSVKPVERETWKERSGLRDWQAANRNNQAENRSRASRGEKLLPVNRFYTADFAPELWEASSYLVIGGETDSLAYTQEWQDGKGHSASFLLGWTMDDDDFAGWERSTRSLGGGEVDIFVRSFYEDSDDSTWREEFWRWTAPDGETVLFLYFFSADNTDPEDEFKLSLYWSVREADPAESLQ